MFAYVAKDGDSSRIEGSIRIAQMRNSNSARATNQAETEVEKDKYKQMQSLQAYKPTRQTPLNRPKGFPAKNQV